MRTFKKSTRRTFIKQVAVTLLSGCALSSEPLFTSQKVYADTGRTYTDAHCHLVNFLQQTQGIKRLLKEADRVGVHDIQIMGLPVIKKWNARDKYKPAYYLDNTDRCYYFSLTDEVVARQYLTLPPDERSRVHPFLCGFNPTDKNCVEHVERMLEWYPGVWKGIGELLLHRAELSMLTDGEQARANHQALFPVYELAERHNLPVQIHSDMGTKALRFPVYFYEVEEALQSFPRTRFIWCHAGFNRGLVIPDAADRINRLLRTYDNVWIDLSWLVFEHWIAPDGAIDTRWRQVISDHPGRFFIGSDKTGDFSSYGSSIKKYDLLFDSLPDSTADMVARSNFLNLLPPA